MERRSGRELTVSLTLVTVDVTPDGPVKIPCPVCGEPLDIHQPDAGLPDRMLCTCENCKGWALVECSPGGASALVVLLPDLHVSRRRGRGGGGTSSSVGT